MHPPDTNQRYTDANEKQKQFRQRKFPKTENLFAKNDEKA